MSKTLDSHDIYQDPPALRVFRLAESHGMPACYERWHWLSTKKVLTLTGLGRQIAAGELSQRDLAEDARIIGLVDEAGGLAAGLREHALNENRVRVAYSRSGRRVPRSSPANATDEQLRAAFAAGDTVEAVAARHRMSRNTVATRWNTMGLSINARAAARRAEVAALARAAQGKLRAARASGDPIVVPSRATLADAIAGGASQLDIAHRAGLPAHVIHNEIRRHRLPRPRTLETASHG